MSDETKQTASTETGDQPQRYQHPDAIYEVPTQRDHLGQCFWDSCLTPEGYEVRAGVQVDPHMPGVIIFVHGVNSEGDGMTRRSKLCVKGSTIDSIETI